MDNCIFDLEHMSERVTNMRCSLETKSTLATLYMMAKTVGKGNGHIMPDLFVVGGNSEAAELGRLYADIIDEFSLYAKRGEDNFVMLTYPYNATEFEYNHFFQIPAIVAATINDFYGVFCVDLSEYHTGREIGNDTNFKTLLEYVKKQKDKITFVFCVDEAFQYKDELLAVLERYLNMELVLSMEPSLKEGMEYIFDELINYKVSLTKAAKGVLRRRLEAVAGSSGNIGYDVLDKFVNGIVLYGKLELGKSEMLFSQNSILNKDIMNAISDKIFDGIEDVQKRSGIGFIR